MGILELIHMMCQMLIFSTIEKYGIVQNKMIYSQVLSCFPKGVGKIKLSAEGKKKKRNKRKNFFFETNFFLLKNDLCFKLKNKIKCFTFSGNHQKKNFSSTLLSQSTGFYKKRAWREHGIGRFVTLDNLLIFSQYQCLHLYNGSYKN